MGQHAVPSVHRVQLYLRHCTNDLDGHLFPTPGVDSSNDFAKGALAEKGYQAVSFAELAILLHDIVPIFVINLFVVFRALSVSVSTGRVIRSWKSSHREWMAPPLPSAS